jgi:hypothetical protein
MAAYAKELGTAEVAYAAIDEVCQLKFSRKLENFLNNFTGR